MKIERFAIQHAFVLLLFCLGAMFSLSSCSKQSTNANQESQGAKVEGRSGNWKVTVLSLRKVPKHPDPDRRNYPSAGSQYDLLEVACDAEFLGQGGKIPTPQAVLIDNRGQESKSVNLSRELPDRISRMEEGRAKEDEISRFMICLTDPCPLTTGEKLSLTYSFIDPKEYTNLRLAFADVPPIPLEVPQDEKGQK